MINILRILNILNTLIAKTRKRKKEEAAADLRDNDSPAVYSFWAFNLGSWSSHDDDAAASSPFRSFSVCPSPSISSRYSTFRRENKEKAKNTLPDIKAFHNVFWSDALDAAQDAGVVDRHPGNLFVTLNSQPRGLPSRSARYRATRQSPVRTLATAADEGPHELPPPSCSTRTPPLGPSSLQWREHVGPRRSRNRSYPLHFPALPSFILIHLTLFLIVRSTMHYWYTIWRKSSDFLKKKNKTKLIKNKLKLFVRTSLFFTDFIHDEDFIDLLILYPFFIEFFIIII